MDSFSLIQEYFTKLSCQFCQEHFEPQGIELVREEEGVFVVSVYCHACDRHIGVAMVGVESKGGSGSGSERQRGASGTMGAMLDPKLRRRFKDPELTRREIKRLAQFDPISDNDVLDAHTFFQGLDENWMQHIPQNLLPKTEPEESGSELSQPNSSRKESPEIATSGESTLGDATGDA